MTFYNNKELDIVGFFDAIGNYFNNANFVWEPLLIIPLILLVAYEFFRRPGLLFRIMFRLTRPFFLMPEVGRTASNIISLDAKLDKLLSKIDDLKLKSQEGQDNEQSLSSSAVNTSQGSAPDPLERMRLARRESLNQILSGFDRPRAQSSDVLQQIILFRLSDSTKNPADEVPLQELLNLRRNAIEEETKWGQKRQLDTVFSEQLESATSIRRAMLNLFVLVNFILIASIIFRSTDVLSNKEIILGLYVSFATFIVYVYRSSNARALILMAGIEDNKRYHDADKYLQLIGKRGPNERDIEALKMLLINRMEREKNSEHPYELVLKGISNSNILMKGGKVSSIEPKDKTVAK